MKSIICTLSPERDQIVWFKDMRNALFWANHRCCIVTVVCAGSSRFRRIYFIEALKKNKKKKNISKNEALFMVTSIRDHQFVCNLLIRFQNDVRLVRTVSLFGAHKVKNTNLFKMCICICAFSPPILSLGTNTHTHRQAVPCLRSRHCRSHMPAGSQPKQLKPPEWQPYLLQTLATSTRIVNMRVPVGGTRLPGTNNICKISPSDSS